MYELSEAAAKDIEQILQRSIVDFGLAQTEIYFHSLKTCLELLGENPGMGGGADDIRQGYRRFAHESHVIFYRASEQGILVVRILHKRMDANKHIEK
ncbi:MAG: type II toxin-antitoxin system RelE/ParE family toxin [Gammaproteobacteria bacterium]|nr:type II toxin-antitoxin system RelE/ParE family toxin [Gammaproteobacteria bacterium]